VGNVKMDVREIGCAGMNWIDVAQDKDQWRALGNTVMKHRITGFWDFFHRLVF
jgi:hypothetical protein